MTVAPDVPPNVSMLPDAKFASTYKSPPDTEPVTVSIVLLRASNMALLAKLPSKFAPDANLTVLDDAVLLKCVVPDTKFTKPSPVIFEPTPNVTPFVKLTVPVFANPALSVSSSKLAVPSFSNNALYVVGSETNLPKFSTPTLMLEFKTVILPPNALRNFPVPVILASSIVKLEFSLTAKSADKLTEFADSAPAPLIKRSSAAISTSSPVTVLSVPVKVYIT